MGIVIPSVILALGATVGDWFGDLAEPIPVEVHSTTPEQLIIRFGAMAGAILAVLALLRFVFRKQIRAWQEAQYQVLEERKEQQRLRADVYMFLDDWNGEPERPGVDRIPGMMERVKHLEEGQREHTIVLEGLDPTYVPRGGLRHAGGS